MADLSPVPPAVPQQQPLSPVPPRRPSLDDVVFGAFGMDPSLKRATLLPVAMNAAGEREWAVPQAVVDMLSSAMLPGHVMKGGAWSPQDVTKMALDVGMLAAPVGAATAPAGALGMFAGKAAKTADHAALARAEAMEQAGADAAKVWDETGWFRGVDDKWRIEIPDDTAKLTLSGRTKETMADDLSRMMFHRNAYDAYPDAKRIYTTAEGLAGDRISGFHQPKEARAHMGLFDIDEQIHVQGPDRRSTALHELQHAIQQREGFAKGGSPQYGVSGPIHYPSFELPMWDVLKAADQLKRLSDQFGEPVPAMAAKYRGAFKIDDDLMAQAVALTGDPNLPSMFERGKLWAEMKPHEAYRRLAGEVEARNVQSRMDMTPEQRRASPPWTTQDTPFEQQIVRMNANGPQASLPPLPMDEASRMARAKEQGYTIDAYKGAYPYDPASGPIYGFKDGKWQEVDNVGAVPKPLTEFNSPGAPYVGFFGGQNVANRFAKAFAEGAVYPMKLQFKNPLVIDGGGKPAGAFQFPEMAKKAGTNEDYQKFMSAWKPDSPYDGVIIKETLDEGTIYVPKEPQQARSRFAAFDPAQRNSADLLAGLAAAGLMLPVAYDYANDGAQPLPPVPSR